MDRDALWSFQGEKTTQKLLSLEEYAVKEKLNIAMYCNLLQNIAIFLDITGYLNQYSKHFQCACIT